MRTLKTDLGIGNTQFESRTGNNIFEKGDYLSARTLRASLVHSVLVSVVKINQYHTWSISENRYLESFRYLEEAAFS